MLRYAVLCLAVYLAGVYGQLNANEKEQVETLWMPIITKCLKDMGITKEMIDEWKNSGQQFDPCFISCVFKAEGVLDAKGMFDKKKTIDNIAQVVKNADTLDKLKEIGENCSKVNKENVSDGEKGCERAVMLAKCYKDQQSNLGFV